ncbi:MAG TPA: hypothetical protein VGE24_02515, partial [Emticicia sp.]
ITLVEKGEFTNAPYKALILQGGYTFYMSHDIKFIPSAYLQVDVNKRYGPTSPGQLLAADIAFRYKDLIYVNGAVSVKNFNFSTTGVQRFGVGFKPKPEIMLGYQRDALDVTDFKYHSIWVKYFFLSKIRRKASTNTSGNVSNTARTTTNTSKSTVNSPESTNNQPKPAASKSKPAVKKKQ